MRCWSRDGRPSERLVVLCTGRSPCTPPPLPGVARQQDAVRAVGEEDRHLDYRLLTERGAESQLQGLGVSGLTRRSNGHPRASCMCIFFHPTTCRLRRPDPEDLGSCPCTFKEAFYAGCWI